MLVWTPGGLPAGFAAGVARIPGVRRSVTVAGGTVWLSRSWSADGSIADRPPAGMAIPLDLAGAPPHTLAPFLPATDRGVVPALASGKGSLGATSSRLRGFGKGGALRIGAHRVGVAGVLPDAEVGYHELLVSRTEARALGVTQQRYVLLQPASGTPWQAIAKRTRALLPAGTLLRIRAPGRARFLRQADAVLPPVLMKSVFGEFAARPHLLPGEWLRIDPRWQASHIVTQRVPILGSATCNRDLFPQLRAALAEVRRRGLSRLIHVNDYGGCFAARMIPGNTGPAIAAHAWGAALDINVSQNPFGSPPHQSKRLVAIFAKWGFTWGGHWLIPDGMHFEFQCFPRGIGPAGGPMTCARGGAVWPPTA